MKQFWIDGVLARKLQGAAALDLDRRVISDAVEHPWERVLELPEQESQVVPAEKPVIEVFQDVNRALLILGKPGSGKTTTLLKLAKDLISKSERDPGGPIPVVLNLSSWTLSRRSFSDWLVDELKAKYYVPERMGRSWLEAHRLLLLLDGLDEVGSERRADCVMAINAYVEEFGVPGLIVCSRFDEYTALPVRLKLHGAVKLQPLTADQVERYLSSDERLSALRDALHEDADLQVMAQNPLMLNVMTSAYRDLPAELLRSDGDGAPGSRLAHVFNTYIRRMFERRGKADQPYDRNQTLSWLSWLAEQMHRHSQTVFLIEQLQPSWLANRPQRWIYIVASRLIGGVALGLVFGLIIDLAAGIVFGIGAGQLLDLAYGIWFGLVFGVVGGLIVGLMEMLRLTQEGRLIRFKFVERWQPVVDAVAYTVVLGAFGGLLVGIIDGMRSVGFGLILGLVFGLFFGLRNRSSTFDSDIRTVEALSWSWKAARKGAGYGMLAGGIAGLIAGGARALLVGAEDTVVAVFFSIVLGALLGLIGGLTGALFTGVRSNILKKKSVPNQGMRLSLRNALLGGSIIGATGAVFLAVVCGVIWGMTTGLAAGAIGGIFLGFLAALWYGILDLIQHGTLRLLLHGTGRMPVNYTPFLDYAVRLVFLQRVGGGYIFMHRGLQEHFAGQGRDPDTTETGGLVNTYI